MYDRRFLSGFWFISLFALFLTMGSSYAAEAPPFPSEPGAWINSPPISVQQLKGKAVFLYFFEESSPRCNENWATLMQKSAAFKDQPIVFIAVNSGNAASDLREYARDVSCTWPMIADVDRSLEKAYDVNEITLTNDAQARYISSDGSMHLGDLIKIEETIQEALKDAAWKLDPSNVPDSLKEAWMAIELGNYKASGAMLRKSLNSPKKELQEAAKRLQEVVKTAATDDFEAAKKASEDEQHWRAYEICQRLSDHFTPADLPAEFAEFKKNLIKEAKVKTGTAARRTLDGIVKSLNAGKPLNKKFKAQLEKMVSDFEDSDLAHDAQAALDRPDEGPSTKSGRGFKTEVESE
ncbi:MAG: redoxin domain-containing protein [Schlesneria sp.]